MGNYERVSFRGHTFDRVTARAVRHGDYCLSHLVGKPVTLPVFQGCYSTAVGASAGTHSGSGAVDVGRPHGASWAEVQKAMRLAGFAAWHRTPAQGDWGDHVHAVLLGDSRVSDSARRQVQDYHAGLSGLANHARDRSWRPSVLAPFRYPPGSVNYERVRDQFRRSSGWTALPGVKHVQRALNLKTGTTLRVDGIAGPKTKSALGRWERQNGGDGDGVPGGLLWLLGAARFEVV